MSRKLTTSEFIRKAQNVHGNVYSYNKVNYITNHINVEIICKNHGEFWQIPIHHLKGSGCPKCSNNSPLTTNEFITKSQELHGNLYDYSKTIYIRSALKVIIICKKHGEFLQRPNEHLSGCGCSKCGDENIGDKCRFTTHTFIDKSKKVHIDKYDYSKVNYNDVYTKVIIICKKHGEFLQSPTKHLVGHGCPKCQHQISKLETDFLDYFNIRERQKYISPYKVDGYDKDTNTIYEYMGDYWHGNLSRFDPQEHNKICHKTYGELYDESMRKMRRLMEKGYNIKYIWESDWKKFKDGLDKIPNIKEYGID